MGTWTNWSDNFSLLNTEATNYPPITEADTPTSSWQKTHEINLKSKFKNTFNTTIAQLDQKKRLKLNLVNR